MNDFQISQLINGADLPTDPIELAQCASKLVSVLQQNLAADNNKLREYHVCSMLGYIPSWGGSGFPDGYKLPNNVEPIDVKSGHNIRFPDGGVRRDKIGIDEDPIEKKYRDGWTIVIQKTTEKGVVYICEVSMADAIDDCREHLIDLRATPNTTRFSPEVSYTKWTKYPSAVCIYKNPALFERTAARNSIKRVYQIINKLTYKPALSVNPNPLEVLIEKGLTGAAGRAIL